MSQDSIVLLRASLFGMSQQAECDILVRKLIRDQPYVMGSPLYSECSVIAAPADLPDGDYHVMFKGHVARVRKEDGIWLLRGSVSRIYLGTR